MEGFNLAQLTKEMVVCHLRNIEDPAKVVAEVVRGTLIARLKGRRIPSHDAQEAISAVCKGAVMGMILMRGEDMRSFRDLLSRGSAGVLLAEESAPRAAGLDHEAASIAAIKGIADSRRFLPESRLADIRSRLEAARKGAGSTFDHFCKDLCQHQSHPDYVPPRL